MGAQAAFPVPARSTRGERRRCEQGKRRGLGQGAGTGALGASRAECAGRSSFGLGQPAARESLRRWAGTVRTSGEVLLSGWGSG